MDKSNSKAKEMAAPVSVRNGPVTDDMDIDEPVTNGKRKARESIGKNVSYAEADSDDDDVPLV